MAVELRVRVTISEHGYDVDNGERLLEGFLAVHADSHPVVSQNTAEGTLTVTFSVEAEDAFAAAPIGGTIFVEGTAASGLTPSAILDVNVSLAEATQDLRELQLA